MSTDLLPNTEARQASSDDADLNHIYCCDHDRALCGADVSGDPEVDIDDADCIVCLDLEDATCPRCGE